MSRSLSARPVDRWLSPLPDTGAYEVGLPNQGIAILYEILNMLHLTSGIRIGVAASRVSQKLSTAS